MRGIAALLDVGVNLTLREGLLPYLMLNLDLSIPRLEAIQSAKRRPPVIHTNRTKKTDVSIPRMEATQSANKRQPVIHTNRGQKKTSGSTPEGHPECKRKTGCNTRTKRNVQPLIQFVVRELKDQAVIEHGTGDGSMVVGGGDTLVERGAYE
eukprot:1150441-Pelagomonas_calceolata.AAC.3